MSETYNTPDKISLLYDQLSRMHLRVNRLRYGDSLASLNMHKTLTLPRDLRARYSGKHCGDYLNDLAFQVAGLRLHPRVLDIGCGFGATIFNWYSKNPGSYDGYTLSGYQQKIAEKAARRIGAETACRFYQRDFDHPLEGQYDGIVAIEALIHSRHFAETMTQLFHALKPGGVLVVADDMVIQESIFAEKKYHCLTQLWSLTSIPSRTEYLKSFRENDLRLSQAIDLTSQVALRPRWQLNGLGILLGMLKKLLPSRRFQVFLAAHEGGLALQYLYRQGYLRYMLYSVQKK